MQRHIAGSQYVKNYEFDFAFGPPWGNCSVTMTSVIGHLYGLDFPQEYRKWHSCRPAQLFDVPVTETIDEVRGNQCCRNCWLMIQKDKKAIADNITRQARYSRALFIWTDCDREGEYIGSEVRQAALKGNARLEVKRAQFSNTERAYDYLSEILELGELADFFSMFKPRH